MASRTVCTALLLVLTLAAGGCLSSGDDGEPTRYYRVRVPPGSSDLEPVPVTIVLRPFHTDGILDREGILYQTSDVERGYWIGHQWIEPVAGMVRSAVQGELERSGLFAAVHLFENEPLADIVVSAEIHEFGESDARPGWYGVVDITFEANRVSDGSLVWRARIHEVEQAEQRTVVETVRALGRALGRVSDKLKSGIIEGVQ